MQRCPVAFRLVLRYLSIKSLVGPADALWTINLILGSTACTMYFLHMIYAQPHGFGHCPNLTVK